jgi:organic hydroperoxide reductase OsmC/OhrA
MSREHTYDVTIQWTGNLGDGTRDYRAYSRDHQISVNGKPVVSGSSDPAFRGDPTRYNPEELLVCSLSSCHMLWFLHLCATSQIVVTDYADRASGVMVEGANGAGRFREVVLRPDVAIEPGADAAKANELHERAHELCFIANSVNFPVRCEPVTRIRGMAADAGSGRPGSG